MLRYAFEESEDDDDGHPEPEDNDELFESPVAAAVLSGVVLLWYVYLWVIAIRNWERFSWTDPCVIQVRNSPRSLLDPRTPPQLKGIST